MISMMQMNDQLEMPGAHHSSEVSQGVTTALSIIIVNWNSLEYLKECLRSIRLDSKNASFETIVVDNASNHDDTREVVAEFPDVRVIKSETNLGFAGANNLGFMHSSGKCLLFLNPDTEILGSAISTMLEKLASLPDAGILGCRLLNSDGTVQTSCVQRYPTIWNQLLDFDYLRSRWPEWKVWGTRSLLSNSQIPAKVEVISGACLMIRREVFQAAGMFSREYFMYAEDVDLCYQVRRLGWSIYCTNDAEIVHHGGGTSVSRKGNAWIAVMQRQAILKFCERTRGRLYAVTYRTTSALAAIFRLTLLTLLFPFRRMTMRSSPSTLTKWVAVLKWAFGIEVQGSRIQAN